MYLYLLSENFLSIEDSFSRGYGGGDTGGIGVTIIGQVIWGNSPLIRFFVNSEIVIIRSADRMDLVENDSR